MLLGHPDKADYISKLLNKRIAGEELSKLETFLLKHPDLARKTKFGALAGLGTGITAMAARHLLRKDDEENE